ncbi:MULTISPECIES: DUF6884 domain-containing protein [Halorussus]|uniref:DUF6884 domain-containing protein n=1 Tax=Halorussus TaxID=1070314 RepID=UPI0020A1EB5C|nr:DUF6884 domain-containing protein [Halorussus vallis]USZ78743.1 hypothetical protein NGM07_24845 [Halorussus vallis]
MGVAWFDSAPGLMQTAANRTTLALVGCGSTKREQLAPASDLYTSTYFAKKRAYAETYADEWRILSAEHGLVHPDAVHEPYDASLNSRLDAYIGDDAVSVWAESVSHDLTSLLDGVDEIVILAGRDYSDPLADYLATAPPTVRYPFEGLGGLPGQMKWLTDKLETNC